MYSLASFSFNLFVFINPFPLTRPFHEASVSELHFLHVVNEITEAHKRRSLVREVTAHARGVATGARVEQHAELVVANVFVLAANFAKVFLQAAGG
jgi:hypothetical protein